MPYKKYKRLIKAVDYAKLQPDELGERLRGDEERGSDCSSGSQGALIAQGPDVC